MQKKLLVAVLTLSTIFEFIFAGAAFFSPEMTLTLFGIGATPDTRFMAFGLATTFVFIGLVCAFALQLIKEAHPHGWTLAILLGSWWIAVGVAIFAVFGKPDNLAVDSLKGVLILVAALKSRPAH